MKTPKVQPNTTHEKYNEIIVLTDDYSAKFLTDEYAEHCRILAESLINRDELPMAKGKVSVWACAIIHALGMVNFLFDKNSVPSIKASDLYSYFNISSSTGSAKSKLIRDMFDMFPLDPHWTLPSRLESNPLIWMLSVNGKTVDIRDMPIEAQEQAYNMGLIPFIPS